MNWAFEGAHGGWLRVEDCTVTDSPHARVIVTHGATGPLVACVAPADLVDVCVGLFKAAGQPAPVITPRPDVDASGPLEFQGVTLSAEPGRVVRIAMDGGCVFREMAPHAARALGGALVAYADAAEAEPDPAEVEQLAALIREAVPADTDTPDRAIAVALLRAGVTLPGGDGGHG